jgi:zinc protease
MKRLLACLFLAATAFAQNTEPKRTSQVLGIEEYLMPNGLRVLLYPDSTAPKVTVNLTVLVGSINEGAGEAGMAHVFEHVLFHSAEGFPDIAKTLKDLGANYNGSTSFDRTNYFETVAASDENLETCIKLEAARLGRAVFKADDLEREGKIVESEFDMNASNPQGLVVMGALGAMYDFHAYSSSPIGTIEDFKALKIENIVPFYRKFYRPDNALLIVTGKFEIKRALDLVQKHFGDLKPSGEPRPVYTTREPESRGERRFEVRKPGESHVVLCAWRLPGGTHLDSATADVFARMLAHGRTGPLYEAVVGKGLAGTVNAGTWTLRYASPFLVVAQLHKDKDPEAVEAAILAAVEKGADALTEADLERAKTTMEQDFEELFNDAEGLAMAFSEAEAIGSWKLLLAGREMLKKVTLADVKEIAKEYFRRENRVVGRFTPDTEAVGVKMDVEPPAETHDGLLSKLPKTSKSVKEFAYTPEGIAAALKWHEVGPAKVGLIQKEVKGDKVFLQFFMPLAGRDKVFAAGSAAGALSSLMTERTKALSKAELRTKLASLNAEIGVAITLEGAQIGITATTATFAETMKLAVEMLRTPLLEEQSLKEFVARSRDQINAQRDQPQVLLQQEIPTYLFPAGDPRRGRTFDERIAALDQLTVDALLSFHRQFLGADGMVVGVVGNVSAADLEAHLGPLVKGWKPELPGVIEKGEVIEKLLRTEGKVETPGKPSAFSVLIQPIRLSMNSAEYAALDAAAWVLFMDPMSSRIPNIVRVQKALSYSTGGYVATEPGEEAGMIVLFSMTKPENADKALAIIRTGLDDALEGGITEEELAAFKKAYTGRVTQGRADDARIAGTIVTLKVAGCDFGMWKMHDDVTGKLTVDEVNAALKKHLAPAKMGLLQVGDFEGAKNKKPEEKEEEEDEEDEDEE